MRIAILHDRLRPNGATRVFACLGNGLTERGHQVCFVTTRGAERLPFAITFPVVTVGYLPRNAYLAALQGFAHMLFHTPPVDLIIGSAVPTAYMVLVTSILRRASGVNFIQGDDVGLFDDGTVIRSKLLRFVYRLIARGSYLLPLKVIANSEWTAQQYRRYGPARSLEIVHPAVDLTIFRPGVRAGNDIYTIVTVGRKHAAKGLNDVLLAIDAVPFQVKLVVVSPDKLELRQRDYPIELKWPESDQQLADIYRSADVFVHASWREGFGMPALEAMACGAPVLLTDSGGVREFAVHEQNCLMSPPQKSEVLAQNIRRLFAEPVLARTLAENGVKTAERFSWDKSVDQIERALALCHQRIDA